MSVKYPMPAKHPTVPDILAEELDEVARSEHVQQIVGAGQLTIQEPSSADLMARRGELWKDIVCRYPEAQMQSAPPQPKADQLPRVDLDTGYITFDNGVPVGGFSHLTIYSDGSYAFTGHYHVSGAPSYSFGLVWVIKDSQGRPFSFSHGGRLHGTFESGSRDDDWAFTGTNQDLARFWPDIANGYSWQWNSAVNIDLNALLNSTLEAIGTVLAVIAVVA